MVYLKDHQAKGQFVALSRRLLEAHIVKPSALGLPKRMDGAPIDWAECKRTVNRQGIRAQGNPFALPDVSLAPI